MQVWGGIECTLNRVHDRYFDQHSWSGHRERFRGDLDRIASLGIRTLRTALHWEYRESTGNWDFYDCMLDHMQRLRLDPIAGLTHHGSGPVTTSLIDPEFPQRIARYAGQVARRYPWITRYTPINEPHTTARFSCLYGHWYPHHRSIPSYLCAVLNQAKATALSMQAIRRVQPAAQLIYTEDGGTTFSGPKLESFRQEREARRWLGIDLLCGHVTPHHPLYDYLQQHGIARSAIDWFQANACPPSVLGFNYYPTSDRFLDDRLDLYPDFMAGGDSGSEPLVDIEALRVYPAGIAGVRRVLTEAWHRYGIPVAVTEAHLGAGPDDQIRWLTEIWNDASAARAAGADVVAVTVWALLGSWNWANLCTHDCGHYEPGAFFIRNGECHRTPLADFVAKLARSRQTAPAPDNATPWWHHPDRITFHGAQA
ncbi:glycoside hydrolase family 1 protein [Terriglobus aquaticus]|uniref:Glycoside hydrolase n=1 Tax=Terriglobus aquaticus TaxID=940139 RepID=A0ABW9KH76_9BACT|nr:glycoside hydrolase [Terriglobus aquaticus]